MYTLHRLSCSLLLLSSTLLANNAAHAGFERGPAPTLEALEAKAGPFAVKKERVVAPSGYGGATVYYPSGTSEGPFAVIAIAPGFFNTQMFLDELGPKIASHGFVVVNISTKTIIDQPESRGKQLMAALTQVATASQSTSSSYYGLIDTNRMGVMGYSMGGGGTLAAARDNPQLKVAFALAPWHTLKNFSKVTVPTMILGCEKDIVAPVADHSNKFYASLTATPSKAYVEIKGGDHFCPSDNAPEPMKITARKFEISWLKRFLDQDTRYTPFLGGSAVDANVSKYDIQGSF